MVTIFGVALLCLGNNFSLNFGDFLCIICALCYAFQMIYTEKYARQDDPVLLGTLQLLFVAVFGLVFSLFLEDFTLPSTATGWGQLLYLAVLCSSVAFILQTSAEKRIPSSHASLIFSAMPVPVALFAYFLLGEPIGLRQYMGIAVVCIGVLIMEYKKSHNGESLGAIDT